MMVLHDAQDGRHRGLRAHLQYRRLGGRGLRQRHALRRLDGGAADRPHGAEVRDAWPASSTCRSTASTASPSTWASPGSAGRTFRWPSPSTTRARSSCRSGRSTSRCCIRRRWSTSATRTPCSGSTTSNAYDLGRFGPMLENHPMFPERANISLAQVTSPGAITLRTWERGAGLTRACGSAACAVDRVRGAQGPDRPQGDGDAAGRRRSRSSGAPTTTSS